jgi:hypothetical protein
MATSESLSSAALHHARGVSATPRRLRDFVSAAGLGDAASETSLDNPQLASMLTTLPGVATVSEMARTVCRDCGLSQNILDQAQTLFSETDREYPTAFDPLIKEMIDQFNKIDERSEIDALQRQALKTARSSKEGLALAHQIAEVIKETRTKDLIGGQIAMLTTLFDQSVASTQMRHREMSGSVAGAFRTAVCKAYSADSTAALDATAFTAEEREELSKVFGYPGESTTLYEALKLHVEEAMATMHVEKQMQ